MEKLKEKLWILRVNLIAALLFHSLNKNMWDMGDDLLDYYRSGYTPKEALLEELSYWSN